MSIDVQRRSCIPLAGSSRKQTRPVHHADSSSESCALIVNPYLMFAIHLITFNLHLHPILSTDGFGARGVAGRRCMP
jgi:hypothetical protein